MLIEAPAVGVSASVGRELLNGGGPRVDSLSTVPGGIVCIMTCSWKEADTEVHEREEMQ
jgi:hypothetical protein